MTRGRPSRGGSDTRHIPSAAEVANAIDLAWRLCPYKPPRARKDTRQMYRGERIKPAPTVLSYVEIAQEMGITPQSVRALEQKALAKLRAAAAARGLRLDDVLRA